MERILIILLFVTSFMFGQDIKYHNPYSDFNNGEYYYLFGDNVKFRNLPDLKSEVLELLKIGTEVKILKKSGETIKYNGIESPFYKVKYKNQVGYILGGLISLEKKEVGSSKFFFVYKKDREQYSLITRHLNQQLQIKETIVELTTNDLSIELHNNKGIDGVSHILFINYLAEACGIDGGGIYFFQVKDELKKVFEISQISDAGVYWLSEDLIFPEDKNGIKGKIVYQKEVGSYKDETTNWMEVKKISRELQWKDGQILPQMESKK